MAGADKPFQAGIQKRESQNEAGYAILKQLSNSNHIAGSTPQKNDRYSNNSTAHAATGVRQFRV
jgi:hypothetical protein